jgi:hypothetical protein
MLRHFPDNSTWKPIWCMHQSATCTAPRIWGEGTSAHPPFEGCLLNGHPYSLFNIIGSAR